MSTIIVWSLITFGGYNSHEAVVISRFATKNDCEHFQMQLPKFIPSICIEGKVIGEDI